MTTRLKIGCYVDALHGIYMGEKIQEIAKEYGWDEPVVKSNGDNYMEAYDEAENYLNDVVAREGQWFGTSEQGDWGLWAAEFDYQGGG